MAKTETSDYPLCSRPASWATPGIAWAGGIGLLMLLIYWEVGSVFVGRWFENDTFHHCIAVPPLLAWLVYQRWGQLQALPSRPSFAGIGLLGAGLLMVVVGSRLGVFLMIGVSFPFVVAGLILLVRGAATLRLLIMPLLVSFFLIAPPMHALAHITMPMQKLSASLTGHIGRVALGMPVTRDGIDLHLYGQKFVVAEKCSGMSSFLALSLTVVFLIEISGITAKRKLIALLSLPPIVICANVVRLSLVLLMAQFFGAEFALGDFVHGATDALVYLSALVLVVLFLGAMLPRGESDEPVYSDEDPPATEGHDETGASAPVTDTTPASGRGSGGPEPGEEGAAPS